jgi:Domain of unknown function (DUF4145)
MERKILKSRFTREHTPDWECPKCQKGILLIKKESFQSEEPKNSRDHNHEDWTPEYVRYIFNCLLYCNNNNCKEVVACTGTGAVDWSMLRDEDGEYEENYIDYFRPTYFEPPLNIIRISPNCPESVSEPIVESFRLFFASPNASANSIRAAIEKLLTELKVKRFNRSNNKLRFIALHQRIALLPAQYSGIHDLLFAIKWLGNAGSHSQDNLTHDDVLDAYEFLEHVLDEVYGHKAKKLKALAKRINKKGGPVKKA